jgi:homoserine O-succinyltransferase/O-acetyltransferase
MLELEPHRRDAPGAGGAQSPTPAIVVGLINNMPDAALEATEGQFTELLRAAAGELPVHLRFSSIPEVPRSAMAREHMHSRQYWPLDALQGEAVDALIVTGMEPGGGPLDAEPYWPRLVALLNWAETQTISSIWSCLAAHAAVQHLNGIPRERLKEKRCGVFEHAILAGHPLMRGVPQPLRLPHSRWNDLPIERLREAGYTILSSSAATGADVFARQGRSLLVCFQGHPEYEANTLLREYRRDVGRFLRGQQARYPSAPSGYFSPDAATRLEEFARRAHERRSPELLAEFPLEALGAELQCTWQGAAVRLYCNWLNVLAEARRPAGTAARISRPSLTLS